jgi:hypothetical protein
MTRASLTSFKTPTPPKATREAARRKRRASIALPDAPDFNAASSDSGADPPPSPSSVWQYAMKFTSSDDDESLRSIPVPPVPPVVDHMDDSKWVYRMRFSDSDESPDRQPPQQPPSPPSVAATLVQPTSRVKCNSLMNKKRRERYAERKLVMKAKATGCDTLLAAALKTKAGERGSH